MLGVLVVFIGLHPIILRHPKQHLSQSSELATIDGPMFIIFDDDAFCPFEDCVVSIAAALVDDDTTKLATFDDEIVDAGVNAEDNNIGRASSPFFPFSL